MRNLKIYPPTKEEVINYLLDLELQLIAESFAKHPDLRIGDMRPTLLRLAAQAVEKHGIEFDL